MGTGLVKTGRFTKKEHVKSSSEIRMLFSEGKKVSTNGAKLFYLPNQLGINRIAFTLPRGYGKAVDRNKSKRLSREIYRHCKANMKLGYDMVLLVYPNSSSFKERCEQFHFLCQKANLLLK